MPTPLKRRLEYLTLMLVSMSCLLPASLAPLASGAPKARAEPSRWVLYEGHFGGQREIYARAVGEETQLRLTCQRGVDRHPQMHPSENILYYLTANPDQTGPRARLSLASHPPESTRAQQVSVPIEPTEWLSDFAFSSVTGWVAYVVHGETHIVSVEDDEIVASFPGCEDPAWSPNSEVLVLSCRQNLLIGYSIDTWLPIFTHWGWSYTGEHAYAFGLATETRWPAFSPDGSRLAFYLDDASHRGQIYVADLTNGTATQVTYSTDEPVWRPRWLSESELIYLRDWSLVVHDLVTGETETVVDGATITNHFVLPEGAEAFLPAECAPTPVADDMEETRETTVVSAGPDVTCAEFEQTYTDGVAFGADYPEVVRAPGVVGFEVTYCLTEPLAEDFKVNLAFRQEGRLVWQSSFAEPDISVSQWPSPGVVTETYRLAVDFDVPVGEHDLELTLFRGSLQNRDNRDRATFVVGPIAVE